MHDGLSAVLHRPDPGNELRDRVLERGGPRCHSVNEDRKDDEGGEQDHEYLPAVTGFIRSMAI